jgi:hypothetical protein
MSAQPAPVNHKRKETRVKHIVSTLVMAASIGLVVSAQADELGDRSSRGYTNADIKGGYGCGVSGVLTGADTVGIAQFHPEGNGTFSESVFVVNIDGVGVCQYSLEKGSGTYDVSANGTGFAQAIYSLQTGSAQNCPAEFSSHLSFVCSGAEITASTCNIATLDPSLLLHGTCTKQNK